MSREKELVKNTFIISLGTILPKLTTLLTLPILTAFLSKTEYGTFDLLSTLISVVLPVATIKIEAAAFRLLIDVRDSKEEAKTIVSTILTFLFPISIIVIVLMFFLMPTESLATRILVSTYFLLDIIYLGLQQIIRGLAKNAIYSLSAIICSVVNMVLIVALVAGVKAGLDGLMLSMCIAQTVAIIIIVFSTRLYNYYNIKNFSKSKLIEMLSYSWPMIPNSLAMWVMNLSDRLIISATLGLEANAIYAVANKIPNLFTTLQGTYVFAWQENASLALEDRDSTDYYSKVFDATFSLLAGMMALLIAATPLIFKILIRGDYMEAYYQMPILFIGMFFSALSSFIGGIYVAHKKTKSVGITTMISAIINFAINIATIRFIGLYAGSISTLISFMGLTFFRMHEVKKFQPINYKYKKMLICYIFLFIMCTLSYINIIQTNIINGFIGIVFVYLTNSGLIKSLIRTLMKKIKNRKD